MDNLVETSLMPTNNIIRIPIVVLIIIIMILDRRKGVLYLLVSLNMGKNRIKASQSYDHYTDETK